MRNTGNVTLAGPVTVDDNLIATVSCPSPGASGLVPDDIVICTGRYWVTQADVDAGSVTNLATATAGGITTGQVSETVDGIQAPGIDLVKTASPTVYDAPGDVISYTYTVINSGNTTIVDPVTVADDQVTVTCPALPADGLPPLATLTCTATDTIDQDDVDAGSLTNNASATDGTSTSEIVSETVTATQSSGFEIVKTPDLIQFENPGDISTYLYTCLLYTSPSPRDRTRSRMPSSA